MLAIFGLEQILGLPCRNVESKPSLIIRMDNCIVLNAGCNKPLADSLNRFLRWGEHFVNLLLRPMLAKVGRRGVRTVKCEYGSDSDHDQLQ
jgi:hypothetical protein